MGRKKRSKIRNAKRKQVRAAPKSSVVVKAAKTSLTKAGRQLDQIAHEFDGAVDGLQNTLEKLRETLPELIALEVLRDRLRLIKRLADDGILDNLHHLAIELDTCAATQTLPESLVPIHSAARIAVDDICRAFGIQKIYQPGESLTVTHEQVKDLDWNADRSKELSFPAEVEVLRSGWKTDDAVFVLPKVRFRHSLPKDS